MSRGLLQAKLRPLEVTYLSGQWEAEEELRVRILILTIKTFACEMKRRLASSFSPYRGVWVGEA